MPWELRASPANDAESLGSVEQVQAKLRAAVPAVQLFREVSGAEKLAEMEARGIGVPDAIREHWLRSAGAFQGLIEGDGFTIELFLGEDEHAVAMVGIDVRGDGDPMPLIERLAAIPGWNIVDANGQPPTLQAWQAFNTWRDDSIEQVGDDNV